MKYIVSLKLYKSDLLLCALWCVIATRSNRECVVVASDYARRGGGE